MGEGGRKMVRDCRGRVMGSRVGEGEGGVLYKGVNQFKYRESLTPKFPEWRKRNGPGFRASIFFLLSLSLYLFIPSFVIFSSSLFYLCVYARARVSVSERGSVTGFLGRIVLGRRGRRRGRREGRVRLGLRGSGREVFKWSNQWKWSPWIKKKSKIFK